MQIESDLTRIMQTVREGKDGYKTFVIRYVTDISTPSALTLPASFVPSFFPKSVWDMMVTNLEPTLKAFAEDGQVTPPVMILTTLHLNQWQEKLAEAEAGFQKAFPSCDMAEVRSFYAFASTLVHEGIADWEGEFAVVVAVFLEDRKKLIEIFGEADPLIALKDIFQNSKADVLARRKSMMVLIRSSLLQYYSKN